MPTFDERANSRRSLTIKEAEGKRSLNGKSKLLNRVNVARIMASKPMRGIRGKDKINGLRKPKERGSKLNGPT